MLTLVKKLGTLLRLRRQNKLRKGSIPPDHLAALSSDQLEAEKTRSEISKVQIEVQELRAWRSKLLFTAMLAILAPLGSILLFFTGWFGWHCPSPVPFRQIMQLPDSQISLSPNCP
jgi:hypothetical protein